MNTCDTCKHWNTEDTDEPQLHACSAASEQRVDGRAFGVAAGEPLNAGIFATGPGFGCVHHEFSIAGIELAIQRKKKWLSEFNPGGWMADSLKMNCEYEIVFLEMRLKEMRHK